MFNRKFSSNIRRKKRMITSAIILLVVFLSVGYAAFTTDLSIGGTLNVSKYDQTLYGVLEKAAKKGIYAREYTGAHQDSMAGVGSEKIYHWYGSDDDTGTAILDKNNVIFANHCWQMIRTTDTGGVKMVYNGEAENNQCLDTRERHLGYYGTGDFQSLSNTCYYGTDYTYDKSNKVFSLSGTVTTGTIKEGQYTCRNTSSTATCETIYLVKNHFSGTSYMLLPLSSYSPYSQFGELKFNDASQSPAYAGYMYNTVYPITSKANIFYIRSTNPWTINTNYYYSATIDYNTTTPNEYTLTNSAQISTLSDYTTLVGKYLVSRTGTHSTNARYVLAVVGNRVYYKNLINGDLNTSLTVGDSYTKSGNTYTLTNPTNVTYLNWYSNTSDYRVYNGKYVCDGNNTSCTNLKHIFILAFPSERYYYFETNSSYSYSENVSYSGGTYTLTGDIKTFWDLSDGTNQEYLSTHHYTCLENGTSCSTVNYVYWLSNYTMYYAQLSNVANVATALNNMLNVDGVNQTNSTMKVGIDAWYKKYMTSYTNKLEDTIFCNDRSIANLGGWKPDGGSISTALQFKNYNENIDLSCANITDRFSLANTKAQLTYPVGLLTYSEINLLNNDNARKAKEYWWTLSPYNVYNDYATERRVRSTGNTNYNENVLSITGVRPAISLKPGTEYVSGTGSMADPYVVE